MMKFEIAMKEMKDVVKKIEKSVTKKAALSILETVLVKQENDQLAFIANNIEEELHIYKNVLVTGNDSFCIALDNLKKIVKLKSDVITITYDSEDKKVLVSTGKKMVSFASVWNAAEDFPLMKDIKEPEEKFFTSNYLEFFNMMEKLYVYLKDSDEYNKAMTYYNFNANKNRITALDGHRLGMCKPSNEVGTFNINSDVKEVNLNRDVWIKLKSCIAKESKSEQNIISIASKDKKTYIVGNDFKMIVRELDIMYFDIDKILLSESDLMMVNVNTSELNESAEYNISFHGKDSKKPMVMKFIGNNIMSYMCTESGESFDKISVSNNSVSEEFMIAFNPLFIKELCSEIDTEFARMGFRNAKSPVMAYDGDFTYLVLPVNINSIDINGNDVEERINKLMKAA